MNLLIKTRKKRGLSQKEVAGLLHMDVSNYNRREKGSIKIKNNEWLKLSELLEVPLESIYESEEIISNTSRKHSTDIRNYIIPHFIMVLKRNYVKELEEENRQLKKYIKLLKEEN